MATFICENSHAHTPSAIQWTNEIFGGQFNVGEKHFVEFRFACHLFQRSYVDAGKIHWNEKERNAFMFLCIEVCSRHQNSPVAATPTAAPHFLAIDDEAVTIAISASGERAKVTSSTWF